MFNVERGFHCIRQWQLRDVGALCELAVPSNSAGSRRVGRRYIRDARASHDIGGGHSQRVVRAVVEDENV